MAFLATIKLDKAVLQWDHKQVIYFTVRAETAQEFCAADETAIQNGNGEHVNQCSSIVDAG